MCCILIAGMPASGKSYMARLLSDRLSLPCMSKDGIKEMLFDELGFASRAEKVRLGLAAERVLMDFARTQLRAHRPFIVENNFERASFDAWRNLLDGHRALTLLMDCDADAAYARMVARDSSPERHRGHIVNTRYPEDAALPYRAPALQDFRTGVQARGFSEFALGHVLRVDASDLARVDYEEIVRLVGEFIEKAEPSAAL